MEKRITVTNKKLFIRGLLLSFMKTFIFLLCTTAFGFTTKITFSQEKITIDVDKVLTIDEVFSLIKTQTKYHFIYPQDLFEDIPHVHLKKGELSVGKLLQKSLPKGAFSIVLGVNNGIIIIPKRLQAQIQVSGTVKDINGVPLPGVTILIKGTNKGTFTDYEGSFNLMVPNPENILKFSYLGMKTQEIKVGNKSIINVIMHETVSELGEVVLNAGYYKVSEKEQTGSISQIKAEVIAKQPVGNVLNALSAQVPGLDIVQQSGIPGSNVTVRIRGENSLTSGANSPLFLVDGIPLLNDSKDFVPNNYRQQAGGGASPFSTLNPADIESVEVLKDAVATAIYGSRGANGVILITTKKGKAGKTSINVDISSGFGNVARKMDVLNRREYLDMRYKTLYLSPLAAKNPYEDTTRISEFGDNTTETWNIEPQLNYNTLLAGNPLSILLGATFQSTIQEGELEYATGFLNDALMRNKSAAENITMNHFYSEYKYVSLFFRFNYKIAKKYFLDLIGRRDGSSRFGPGKNFGNFGALGAAWVFSDEPWIKENFPSLSFGKLRSSYGVTGSDAIGNYGYMSLFSPNTGSYMYYGDNGLGLEAEGLANNDYQWESNRKFDVALELGFLKNRIVLNTNYYNNRSGSQLVGYPLSAVTGFQSVTKNLEATVENTGWEIELNTTNIESSSFKWETNINLTIPRNKLVDYPNLESSSHANTYVIGEPLSITKLVPTQGINPETGSMVYLNADGEEVTNINSLTISDRTVVVSTAKEFYGGIYNGITYKNFQLDFLFQFAKSKGLIYNVNGVIAPGWVATNIPQYVYDNRWTGIGSNGTLNQLTQSTTSDAYLARARNTDDAAFDDIFFSRLKNVSLSYRLEDSVVEKLKMSNIYLYAQGQNLATFTNYQGMDPENQSASIAPIATIMFGLKLTF